jgi:hypothetical protein
MMPPHSSAIAGVRQFLEFIGQVSVAGAAIKPSFQVLRR